MFEKFKNLKLFENCKLKIVNLSEYFFYLFLFLLPWQTQLILRPGLYKEKWPVDYWTIVIFGTDILLVGLFIFFAVQHFCHPEASGKRDEGSILGKSEISSDNNINGQSQAIIDSSSRDYSGFRMTREGKILLVILICLNLAVFVSIFFAPDKILALYKYAVFLLGIGLFWLVVKSPFNKIKAAYVFLAGLFLPGILAVYQFFVQSAFGSKWLGMAEHLASTPGSSVIETAGSDGVAERWLRAYGLFSHPNILGGVMAIGLIFLIYYFLQQKQNDNNKKFVICNLSFVILFSSLLFSFSRAAWLSFIVGMFLFFIFYFFQKNWLAIKRLGGAVLLLAVVSGIIFFSYQNLFITRANGQARLEIKSIDERKMYLEDAKNMLKNNWLQPRGIGNYTAVLADKNNDRPWYYFQSVHNVFLLVWLEIGPWGLLFFLLFLAYLFWQSFKNKNILGLSILVMLCIIMALDHWLWSLHFGILFFWLMAGLIIKINKEYEIKETNI